MTPEEAQRKVAAQKAELARLEQEVGGIARGNPGPVMLAMLEMLVEFVCRARGDHFVALEKLRFYRLVIESLRRKGLS